MLLPAAATQCYVHGDCGTANVIVDREGAATVLRLVDFEDSHVGDPAEDFKWQVLAGPQSLQYTAMRAGYATAGRTLGPRADERLALAGAELCLDVLRWDALGDRDATFQERCLQTLDQLVSGHLPAPP